MTRLMYSSVDGADRPIDWTLGHLKEWYGKTYDEKRIAAGRHRGFSPMDVARQVNFHTARQIERARRLMEESAMKASL